MPTKKSTTTLELSHEYLLERLSYNPNTGIFTWREHQDNARCLFSGKRAGTVSGNGYISIKIKPVAFLAHRLAWLYVNGSWPIEHIDHINHNKADNRYSNLREVPKIENSQNRSKASNNTSGVTGVYWCNRSNKWLAKLGVYDSSLGRTVGRHLGYFPNKREAVAARKAAEKQHGYHPNHGK